MRKVDRSEILDLGGYEAIRERFRRRIIETKHHRRVSVGEQMTFVFENRDTVLFQIQEMLRTERITAEKGILHEIGTYNDLVPGDGQLSATLFIEYDDPAKRSEMLSVLADLESHIRIRIGDQVAQAAFQRLPGEEPDRLPAVNYLLFDVGSEAAEALRRSSAEAVLEVSHPAYEARTDLTATIRAELADDLEA